jgi:DNA invertase Pin-like site-specific DNA recombinase
MNSDGDGVGATHPPIRATTPLEGQCQRLSAAGCDKLFEEKISGVIRNRPKLEKLIEHLRKDDILVVTRLDRLARSTSDLLRIAERLTEKSAGLQSP